MLLLQELYLCNCFPRVNANIISAVRAASLFICSLPVTASIIAVLGAPALFGARACMWPGLLVGMQMCCSSCRPAWGVEQLSCVE